MNICTTRYMFIIQGTNMNKSTKVYDEKLDHFHLRLPNGTLDTYKKMAKERGTSLNALIVKLLEEESEASNEVLDDKIKSLKHEKSELQKEVDKLKKDKETLLSVANDIVKKLK